MTLRVAHQLGLASSLTLSIVAALWGQALPPWAYLFVLAPWFIFGRRGRGPIFGKRAAGVLVAASAAVALAMAASPSQGPIVGALFLVLCMLTLRLTTRALPSHDLHALALGLLLLLAGTALSQDVAYAVLFVAYAIATTWALITRQLWHELTMESFRTGDTRTTEVALASRDVVSPRFFIATAIVALLIALGGAISFVLLPRFAGGGFRIGRVGQLSGDVHLGDMSFGGGDDAVIAARVYDASPAAYARGIYLRAIVYDAITPKGFSRTEELERLRPSLLLPAANEGPLNTYRVKSAPLINRALPVMSTIASAAVLAAPAPAMRASLTRGTAGELWTLNPGVEAITYRISGHAQRSASDISGVAADLRALLPQEASLAAVLGDGAPSLSPNIRRLAQTLCASPSLSFASRANRIRSHLQSNFTYVRRSTSEGAATPLEDFLFTNHRGHCEYFATAMAALLRECGVPSRIVGGYYGGTWDEDGPVVLFYGKHAHSWVEWYAPGVGWIQDDATPSAEPSRLGPWARRSERLRDAWERHVINFGLGTQLQLLRQVAGLVPSVRPASVSLRGTPWRTVFIGGWVTALVASFVWAWRRWRRARSPGTRLGSALLDALNQNLSEPLSPALSLRMGVARLARERPKDVSRIARLTEVLRAYEAERFGAQAISQREVSRLIDMLAEETRFALDQAPKAH